MSVTRLACVTPIGVEQMGELADRLQDRIVLRLENPDTDLRPPASALEFTKRAVDDDDANSYLPFFGLDVLRQAAANLVSSQAGQQYHWRTECIISAGGLSGILNVLLATLLKAVTDSGFVFCTQYDSNKSAALAVRRFGWSSTE